MKRIVFADKVTAEEFDALLAAGWTKGVNWQCRVFAAPPRDPSERRPRPGDDDYDPTPTWYEPF